MDLIKDVKDVNVERVRTNSGLVYASNLKEPISHLVLDLITNKSVVDNHTQNWAVDEILMNHDQMAVGISRVSDKIYSFTIILSKTF